LAKVRFHADKMALLHMAECWRDMAGHEGADEADRPAPLDHS
jgi:hypothetical protein